MFPNMLRHRFHYRYIFGALNRRTISSYGLFENNQWLIRKPQLKYLNAKERKNLDTFKLNIDPEKRKCIYTTDKEFKKNLENALAHVYSTQIENSAPDQVEFRKVAWLRLKDMLYNQLLDKNLPAKINGYDPGLMETISPTQPQHIIPHLVKMNKIDQLIWKKITGKTEGVTKYEQFQYLLSSYYDCILNQEIIPSMLNTGTDDSVHSVDFSNPAEWFPEARKIRRHIIMHVGPTNSGKTFRSLQKLKAADRGYYAGPLRLLAREVYEKFKHENVRCNLLTGEEVIKDLDEMGNEANLTSGTIEMIPLNQNFDVVVLDEIQMMADLDRGWAWTNALLGAKAKEVHCCGEASTIPLIKKIVEMTGDKLTINEYERMGKLVVEEEALTKGYHSLKKGDCVVAFSKKAILDLKLEIEKKTELKAAVIYGSLPPETRVKQANLFNSGEFDILIASDAIGMGLNLSIDRVVFTTSKKFDGRDMVDMTSSAIKQIGGRAGRFKQNIHDNGELPVGYITAVKPNVLKAVREAINAPIEYLTSATTWPTDEICTHVMTRFMPGTTCKTLLETIAADIEQSSNKLFQICDLKARMSAIEIIDSMEDITFSDKLRLSNAPLKDFPLVKAAFKKFCDTIARGHTRGLLSYRFPFDILNLKYIYTEKHGLEEYEALYNIIMLFFWLSNRYPNYFIDQESASELKNFCEMIIFEKIDHLKRNPYIRKKFISPYLKRRR
ncbi:SUV3 [Nakaseomyces glabratus]|uniref:ATP-dependent RNA helicase SUV3, mitochondrial n=1 Tax=Candida glabrata (strain ATCC 2001 / BCRC 20586 / JCM 3761 / NBRC 0622 / NRRL Y-65 / CBS 138) TaxID=284593 RepID=Q6FKD7_CANGA|nr:uncharacterized protein CAGL0L12386g [Nakaseomyces glabratus]KAH7581807.1 Superfamilies 1 and 2 helicase ATP-binding type-1 domain profile [Nakaseomyces glabratus]KAH7594264.1 Superfamilies 1 and 2 helicase ATP-binding type-1 domain profile [Nakaseomyces glabratus]KAH7594419.1 Superfamilies 1 and 2 helicase ATP-binding type-1 domain profile [Nakaseomyces glabratus]KAH7601180.1 Superfamilies 1 and 2 helicase ATP-binding type-1 domain profile [Nakaseomyces glabratus]KAH7611452.1 Superfamilies|eukprot:XP_449307.1 uncharacterized protein CAGL0L12386g [[Candida] glabrata]